MLAVTHGCSYCTARHGIAWLLCIHDGMLAQAGKAARDEIEFAFRCPITGTGATGVTTLPMKTGC